MRHGDRVDVAYDREKDNVPAEQKPDWQAPAYHADGRARAAGFFPTTADMNTPVVPMGNPNARTVEPQKVSAKADGTIVYY